MIFFRPAGEGGDDVDIAKSDTLKKIIEAYFHEKPLGIEVDESFNKVRFRLTCYISLLLQ